MAKRRVREDLAELVIKDWNQPAGFAILHGHGPVNEGLATIVLGREALQVVVLGVRRHRLFTSFVAEFVRASGTPGNSHEFRYGPLLVAEFVRMPPTAREFSRIPLLPASRSGIRENSANRPGILTNSATGFLLRAPVL